MTAEIEIELWGRHARMEEAMKPDLDHLLSDADVAAVESIYKKNTTPLRCRLGLHKWNPWQNMFSIQFGAESALTTRVSEPRQIDLQVRLCPNCMATQARTVRAPVDHVQFEQDDDE